MRIEFSNERCTRVALIPTCTDEEVLLLHLVKVLVYGGAITTTTNGPLEDIRSYRFPPTQNPENVPELLREYLS